MSILMLIHMHVFYDHAICEVKLTTSPESPLAPVGPRSPGNPRPPCAPSRPTISNQTK